MNMIIKKIIDYFLARIYFCLGGLCCFLNRYNLYNFKFSFEEPSLDNKQGCLKNRKKLAWIGGRINSACKVYLSSKYYKLREDERKLFLKKNIWGSYAGKKWHYEIEKFYTSSGKFIQDRENLISAISALKADEYEKIIEIGTGNGWFLDILSKKIKSNAEFIGLDLNSETVEMARSRYKDNPCFRFVCSDMRGFAGTNSIKKAIIVSCFVLEYFSSQELADFYNLLKNNAPCYLAMIERVSIRHSDKGETIPIGNFSYSHDYEKIFERLGAEKLYSCKEGIEGNASCFNLTALFKI